jgi:hypothetical protein
MPTRATRAARANILNFTSKGAKSPPQLILRHRHSFVANMPSAWRAKMRKNAAQK